MRRRIIGPFAGALALSALAGGCLIVSGKDVEMSGEKISQATLGQIVPGQTTAAWVLATLGEPTERTVVDEAEAVEVFRYRHVVTRAQGAAVFLIFAGGSKRQNVTTTFIETVDGVVSRFWTEQEG